MKFLTGCLCALLSHTSMATVRCHGVTNWMLPFWTAAKRHNATGVLTVSERRGRALLYCLRSKNYFVSPRECVDAA
jgi:hypothetical protein